MSEAKFTKGPFEACEVGDYGDFNGNSRVILADDKRIAVVHCRPGNAEDNANADLFAAGPELYAACEDARKYLINEFDEPGRTVFWKLVATLKKARGES